MRCCLAAARQSRRTDAGRPAVLLASCPPGTRRSDLPAARGAQSRSVALGPHHEAPGRQFLAEPEEAHDPPPGPLIDELRERQPAGPGGAGAPGLAPHDPALAEEDHARAVAHPPRRALAEARLPERA